MTFTITERYLCILCLGTEIVSMKGIAMYEVYLASGLLAELILCTIFTEYLPPTNCRSLADQLNMQLLLLCWLINCLQFSGLCRALFSPN